MLGPGDVADAPCPWIEAIRKQGGGSGCAPGSRQEAPRRAGPPTTHVATGAATGVVLGHDLSAGHGDRMWFHLYLILDLYSRKIVGWEAHATDDSVHAAHLVRRTALAEGIATMLTKPVLHGDNGATLKATTVLGGRYWLGVKPSYSRPRVSDDNAYAESLFRTAKYRPEFPPKGFADLDAVRTWAAEFVRWYNDEHRHSPRHPLCHPWPAPLRRRSRHPGGSTRALPSGPCAQPGALVRHHARLVAHRRSHPQPRTRLGRRGPHESRP